MNFSGFTSEDFAVFEIDGFESRMPVLRRRVTPKLKELGPILVPEISILTGHPMFAHVALHMRRTVNPPEATWVAFGRNARSYKPFVHYRVVASRDGLKVTCFVEDDADDKPTFANGMVRNSASLAHYFAANPEIRFYELLDANGEPRLANKLTKKEITAFGGRLRQVKGQHASFGIPIDPAKSASGTGLVASVLDSVRTLHPLYRMGAETGYRLD